MLLYKIGLTLIPNVGPKIGKKLVSYCGGVEAIFKEKKTKLLKIPGVGDALANSIISSKILDRAEKEIKLIEKYNIKPLFYLDKAYPERLKQCVDNPLMLYYKGNADLNALRIISIVGSRRTTEYGKEVCNKIVEGLSELDVLIVSGLAYGTDTCSHKAALENGLKTIGILAHGLDRVYPPLNKSLAKRMIKNGGLLTEFISGTIPERENFPKRNRIIAGIADAVVVIEAGKKSGALITADIANSYNRDVFAVPGRITDTYSTGCNNFIKTNRAALIQSADDIKYIMGWDETTKKQLQKQQKLFVKLSVEEEKIVSLLKNNGESNIDWLFINSKLPMSKVASILLNLEFKNLVKSMPGKMYKLI